MVGGSPKVRGGDLVADRVGGTIDDEVGEALSYDPFA